MAISLASIKRGVTIAPPRIVLYAPHGVGKTTFGASTPSPILLPFEDGEGVIDVPRFPKITSWAEAIEALSSLANEQHDFRTAVVDTLDWMEPLVWAETCARNKWADIEAPGFGKGYIAASDTWREFFKWLDYLRDAKGMSIVLLAHTEVKTFNDPANDNYDRYQIKLQKRAADLVQEWGDAVLFANYRVYTTKSEAGFKKVTTKGTGSGERVMFTEERPSFYAKNRYGLPPELPFSYAAFAEAAFKTPTANT